MRLNDTLGILPGQPKPATFPPEAAPWGWILADNLAYNGDNSPPNRYMHDAHLKNIAANLALMDITLPFTLAAWKLPQLDGPGFWAGTVLPQIRAELARRAKPPKVWGAKQSHRQTQAAEHRRRGRQVHCADRFRL